MTNLNGYLVPKMAMKEAHRPPVGRIGLQREKFLQENHSLLYDKMLLDGTLYSDLKQTEQHYWEQVEQTITKLLVSNPAPDKNKLRYHSAKYFPDQKQIQGRLGNDHRQLRQPCLPWRQRLQHL